MRSVGARERVESSRNEFEQNSAYTEKTNKDFETEVSKGSKDLIPVQTSVFRLQSLASRLSDVQNC